MKHNFKPKYTEHSIHLQYENLGKSSSLENPKNKKILEIYTTHKLEEKINFNGDKL